MRSRSLGMILIGAIGLALAGGATAEAGGVLYASLTNGVIKRFDLTTGQDLGTFASGLSSPQGLAFDSEGNLFVANGGDGTVSKIAMDGTVSTFASGFLVPTGLAFDTSGNLYVANYGNVPDQQSRVISKVAPDGTVTPFANVGTYSGPNGLVFGADGNLYATVSPGDRISRILPDGTVSVFVPGPGTGLLDWPTGLTVDDSGNLYTVNSVANPSISQIAPDGTVTEIYQAVGRGGRFQSGIVFDQESGDLFAANFRTSLSIDRVTTGGSVTNFVSGLEATPQFLAIWNPQVTVIPEPPSVVLALSGAVAAFASKWCRRKR